MKISFFKASILVLFCIFSIGFWSPMAFAQSGSSYSTGQNTERLPLLGEENYDPIIQHNIVKDVVDQSPTGTEDVIRQLFQRQDGKRSVISIVNVIVGVFALIFLAVVAIRFIFADGDDESLKTAKIQAAWVILGLAVISVAEFVAFTLLDPAREAVDPLLESERVIDALGDKVEQIIDYIEIVITGVMLVYLGLSGYSLITAADGGDERLEEEKKFLKTFFLGAALILLAESISLVFSNRHPQDGIFKGTNEVLGLINYALTFLGGAAFVMLILAAFYFVTSFGNEEQMGRAKKLMIGCVLGIIVAISSYALVTVVIR
jgi:hypothetical protein